MRVQTVKYVLVKAVIDHDDKTDADDVCKRAELVADINGGFIDKMEIVDVIDPADLKDD